MSRPPVPIAALGPDQPIAYGALGAVLHLQPLAPDDGDRLTRVGELVWEWFGKELRWADLSCAPRAEPALPEHLDFMATYPASLRGPVAPTFAAQADINSLHLLLRMDHSVWLYGGDSPASVSPFSFQFWAEPTVVLADSPDLLVLSVIRITVDESWPADDFLARIRMIAAELPLRWGAAGYSYSINDLVHDDAAETAVMAHCRRFWGYDVGAYIRQMAPFYNEIRSVSWLTLLGRTMLAELAARGGRLEPTGAVAVEPLGPHLLVRAGDRPERGDINRLQIPAAYREADRMLRPIRAKTGDLFHPWDPTTTAEWLTRFERRV